MQKAERDKLITDFALFNQRAGEKSEKFRFWNIFLDNIMPTILDVTRSFRNANWDLHLSAARRALPLLFAFGRTNYSRWTPIYYQDCLNLETHFPLLHAVFRNGDFIVNHTARKVSGVPIDQALEKE